MKQRLKMKKKQYFYKNCGRRIDILSINTWLCGFKDYCYKWDMLNKGSVYGVKTLPKRRHKRSIVIRNRNLFDLDRLLYHRKVAGYRARRNKTKGLWFEPCSHRLTYRLA